MDAVIKVGGSLAENPAALRNLCKTLSKIAKKYSIVVVPGGGKFADTVRDMDKLYSLPPKLSHRMAILGMDQYGLLLSELIQNSAPIDSLNAVATSSTAGVVSIFLPSKLFIQKEPLEATWSVTSDSVAAFVASRLHAEKLILVTNVDGIFTTNPENDSHAKLMREIAASDLAKLRERTSVDVFLPGLLLEEKLDCYVVNGAHPQWIAAILKGEPTICTLIVAK